MSSKETVQKLLSLADIRINGDRDWDIQVHNPKVYSRILSKGSLGLGESYMNGWWDVKKLDQFFYKVLRVRLDKRIIPFSFILRWIKNRIFNQQTRKKSLKVAKQHYNLGNDFYKKILGKTMQYTCAYWKNAKTLDEAQEDKLDLICKKLQLKKGEHVLELGTGWGGFAYYAAKKYKVKVTSFSISSEQIKFARELCKGLPVEIHQADYRDIKGTYDKITSIGMCEHVGSKNYKTLMKIAKRCLADNGLFLLHTIGQNKHFSSGDPWIVKYIFPNSEIPTSKQLIKASTGLFIIEDWHNFGIDYDKTLMGWYKNFVKNWDKVKDKYDNRVYRMWSYYFLCCAGGFRARYNQLWQIVFSKRGIEGGYKSIR